MNLPTKKRSHKFVLTVVASCPVSEAEAKSALKKILEQQGCIGRYFFFDKQISPRYRLYSWLKSFAYAAGKYQEGKVL